MAGLIQGAPKAERSDAVANRQHILEAAREVFARRGLDAEIKELAERAGVGIGTLYRHFESREGLLVVLVHQAGEDLLRRIQAVVETEEPRAALRAVIHAGAEFCEQFGALAGVVLLADRIEQPDNDAAQARQLLADLLQRGMADRVFRSDLDIAVATATLESIFRSGAFLELAAQRSCPAAADAVADFFLNAVGAPTSSAST
jgi:AcrR family transcriptional regulator